jgi:hypothetical protein
MLMLDQCVGSDEIGFTKILRLRGASELKLIGLALVSVEENYSLRSRVIDSNLLCCLNQNYQYFFKWLVLIKYQTEQMKLFLLVYLTIFYDGFLFDLHCFHYSKLK